jgi:pSer/pThr/pTyr-binding forkhead associated (FHA) protein
MRDSRSFRDHFADRRFRFRTANSLSAASRTAGSFSTTFVSRHHCVPLMADYTLRIRDLGSKNGTYVNRDLATTGERILVHGDTLRVADLVIRIELGFDGALMPADSFETDVVERDTTQFDNRSFRKSKVDQPSSADVSQNATRD